jgi:hypothetical protein
MQFIIIVIKLKFRGFCLKVTASYHSKKQSSFSPQDKCLSRLSFFSHSSTKQSLTVPAQVSTQDSFSCNSQIECFREPVVMENFLRAKSSSATFGYTLYKLMEELRSNGGRVGPSEQCLSWSRFRRRYCFLSLHPTERSRDFILVGQLYKLWPVRRGALIKTSKKIQLQRAYHAGPTHPSHGTTSRWTRSNQHTNIVSPWLQNYKRKT